MITVLAYLLVCVLTSAVLSIYGFFYISAMTPLILIVAALMFGECMMCEKYKLPGTVVILATIITSIALVGILSDIGGTQSNMYFWQWVLNRDEEEAIVYPYVIALLLGTTVFLSTTIYYFAKVLYRVSFLTLVSLIPCVLYIKVTAELDNIYLVLISGLNLAIHLFRANNTKAQYKCVGKVNNYLGKLIYILIVLAICAAIPKQEDALYYKTFEGIFLNGNSSAELAGNYEDFTDYSGNADNYESMKNRRMYSLYMDSFVYVKRQVFDIYDADNDRWQSLSAVNENTQEYEADEWQDKAEQLSVNKLNIAIKRATVYNPKLLQSYRFEFIADGETVEDSLRKMKVYAENFGARYYLSCARGVSVEIYEPDSDYKVLSGGTFARESGTHGDYASYELMYYSEDCFRSWIENKGCDYSNETALKMLGDVRDTLSRNKDPYLKYVESFLEQQNEVDEYKVNVDLHSDEISDEIKALSEEITRDCTFDWEKAEAIEKYFHSGDFKYDVEYVPEDKSVEYFLFTSKTGTCSDYATAYTLIARAAGLTVRYVEGYLPKQEYTGAYYVSDSTAHAYPEVFIPNYGWKVYEPTVASYEEKEAFSLIEWIKKLKVDYGLLGVIVVFAVVMIIAGGVGRFLTPFALEIAFRIRIRFVSDEKLLVMCYRRLIKKAEHKKKLRALMKTKEGSFEELTPNELKQMFLSAGKDIEKFTELLEKGLYGKKKLSSKERRSFIRAYERF